MGPGLALRHEDARALDQHSRHDEDRSHRRSKLYPVSCRPGAGLARAGGRKTMSNAFPAEDGNFKRGATKPIIIVLGLLIAPAPPPSAFPAPPPQPPAMTTQQAPNEP